MREQHTKIQDPKEEIELKTFRDSQMASMTRAQRAKKGEREYEIKDIDSGATSCRAF